jgi:ectoine hydroxylase-related dioxygenase (phytanoyl-CoA dioxygenase family)
VRLYHDQALFKEPGGGPTMTHQDHHYWPIDTDKTITMWMPLVPVSAAVGSMTFITGSHKLGELKGSGISDEAGTMLDQLIEERKMPKHTYGAMAPGDATWHDGWTLHGAPANKTNEMREVMTIIYIAADARMLPFGPHQSYDVENWMPGLKPGDLVASPQNPVLFTR